MFVCFYFCFFFPPLFQFKKIHLCVGKTGQLSTENVSLQSEVKSQRELIEQLELDVSSLQNLSSLNRGEAEVFNI